MKLTKATGTIKKSSFLNKTMYPLAEIEQLFLQASLSQEITETDWQQLEVLSESPLSPEAQRMVKRIVHGVRRGWVTVLG